MQNQDLKVLLVEDDQSTRSTIRMMLGEMGVTQVIEGADGKSAQDFIDADAMQPDLIISDWNMPNKTGFEFLREIQTTHQEIPFIMITGRADVNSVQSAMQEGVAAYIRKPFTLQELEEKITKVLSREKDKKSA